MLVDEINTQIRKMADGDQSVRVPKTLGRRVRSLLKKDPTLAWDEALTEIVEKRRR